MRNLMKLIPKKKQSSVMSMVKQALENESLFSKAQDLLISEGITKGSDYGHAQDKEEIIISSAKVLQRDLTCLRDGILPFATTRLMMNHSRKGLGKQMYWRD